MGGGYFWRWWWDILVEVPGSFMVFKNQGGVGVGIFWKKKHVGMRCMKVRSFGLHASELSLFNIPFLSFSPIIMVQWKITLNERKLILEIHPFPISMIMGQRVC